jgi:hypothetical protein
VRHRFSLRVRACVLFVLAMAAAGPAAAQPAQTFVSSAGTDVGFCFRTVPCQTFAYAITVTAAGGEIDAVDAGSYGFLPITKAITIDGGPFATVSGIVVNAGAGDVVTIRNVSINTFGIASGVRILAGRSVLIENCSIAQNPNGIDFEPTRGMTVTVRNTTIRNNGGVGIFVRPAGAFFARLTVTDTRLMDNGWGMLVEDNSLVFVSDSVASNNLLNGFQALSTSGGPAQLDLESTKTANNGNAGVVSQNVGAAVTISNVVVDHNGGAGIVPLAGGQILTGSNNKVNGNAAGPGTTTGALLIM